MSCIDVKHLSKSYGSVHAVKDLELLVRPGQVFGFLGPNGAGKSTTIKLLTTLIPPSNGNLSILGIDAVANPLQVRHKIGVVLQQPSYEPTLSVEKSLDKYGMMWNVPKTERKKRMEQLLIDFDLVEIRKKRNEDLSIGQRRRIQVAREFMHDMELLFLDEPTVGLDPSARRNLLDYLKNKVKTGLTIFYTTHILTEAEYLCDEIAIIDKGRILTVDSPDALKKKFGKEKTIKIHLSEKQTNISSLLTGISDFKIDYENGTNIIIHSEQSELVLLKVLKILNDNTIEIEDLSAVPTNLEEIFLKMMRDNASNS
ncbi:daunorubicin resistance protein DrrA family ABC transporter ATP-binding protein [Nitrosopumilus zosterae]|uniref:Daunorubicin resistance protein DrrA family ABC transporter ATP-binding protein n=1 Tax=Nitrosopumilus zosterae TaxID=718286 RepID=A0A2S2KU86_9ARCH|nr:ABC transporter ATP-binding protein [Nitrosopumilus zosterae]BDQ31865.1 ABC transporter ATP-binding protein [Nitrosopumilus zosterae]GBH35214.1 daunorubicin resistance protein DrrA family ABC transporter ATP-binding protein [Nitrosopumilus zosterae]